MRTMSIVEYQGYTVVINPVPTTAGKFRSAFAIHKDNGRTHALTRTTIAEADMVYQSSASTAEVFNAETEAYDSAKSLAHAWIDAAIT